MKIIISAIALTIAIPAAAQTAPVQSQHQQHGQQQHGPHQQPLPAQPQGHGDCCVDRNGNGRMDCCENMAPSPAPRPQADDGQS